MMTLLRPAAILAALSSFVLGTVRGESLSDEKRMELIGGLQRIEAGKEPADSKFALEAETILAAIQAGDEGLAYHLIQAGDRMLDSEEWFPVLCQTFLKQQLVVNDALRYKPKERRRLMFEALKNADDLRFTDDPDEEARFKEVIHKLAEWDERIGEAPSIDDGKAAYIDDPDGYTNVRLKPGTKESVIDQIKSGEEFRVISEGNEGWCWVKTPRGDLGYMHKSRVHYKYMYER